MTSTQFIRSTFTVSLILLSINVSSKKFNNPYEFTMEYHIVNMLPENATQRVLIVSNREFIPQDNYSYERKVSESGLRFFFIVSQIGDSTFISSYSSLESALKIFSNNKSFLLFVNGHGKNFEQTISRGFELSDRYDVNMIMFDWPTEYYALRKTVRNAKKVTQNFVLTVHELNESLIKWKVEPSISVMFHSMGNHIARNMVREGYADQLSDNIFQNLILNAAAVNQRNHREWVDNLNIQKRIYIVSSEDDLPLKGVKILRLTTPLGSKSKGNPSPKAYYINFSAIADKEHNIFIGKTQVESNHPAVFNFYSSLFTGEEIDLTNSNEFAEIDNGYGYYIL